MVKRVLSKSIERNTKSGEYERNTEADSWETELLPACMSALARAAVADGHATLIDRRAPVANPALAASAFLRAAIAYAACARRAMHGCGSEAQNTGILSQLAFLAVLRPVVRNGLRRRDAAEGKGSESARWQRQANEQR